MAEIAVCVRYPVPQGGRLTLRNDQNWDADLEVAEYRPEESAWLFRFSSTDVFHYFKPVLHFSGKYFWSKGNNYLILADGDDAFREIYPYFFGHEVCSECGLEELADGERRHRFRVFYPPGYHENPLKRYPVLYMQDGQNLFFPEESFSGESWRVRETLTLLDQMNIVDKLIVVGIYPQDRMADYTAPGYREFGRFLVEKLKPRIDAEFRTLPGPQTTALMGASLGGVLSFYLAWEYPQVFGMAACMSSTFGYRDDLFERVGQEAKRDVRFYLDSGWPGDNYEVTRDMRALLRHRGYEDGRELMYLAFPNALHNEREWALRAHIPIQLFFGGQRPAKRPGSGP